jgi:hypothetical protein
MQLTPLGLGVLSGVHTNSTCVRLLQPVVAQGGLGKQQGSVGWEFVLEVVCAPLVFLVCL